MDLFRPTRSKSFNVKKYCLVIIDNYSRLIWVRFLALNHETFKTFVKFAKKVQNEKVTLFLPLKPIMGENLERKVYLDFYDENNFKHNFSSPYAHSKMELLKRKTGICKTWQEPC